MFLIYKVYRNGSKKLIAKTKSADDAQWIYENLMQHGWHIRLEEEEEEA